MRIEIKLEAGAVQRALAALQRNAAALAPALKGIGADIADEARLGFKDGTDPYGVKWRALKASTIARRRKRSSKPLLDTGRLRNSIASRLVGPAAVEVGSNVAYAAIHQFGGRAGRGRKVQIPARPFIATRERGLPRAYGEIIRDRLTQHLMRGVSGGGAAP